VDKVVECEWSRINAFESQVFLLEGRFLVLDAAADIPCFWAEEYVQNELDAVDLVMCQLIKFWIHSWRRDLPLQGSSRSICSRRGRQQIQI